MESAQQENSVREFLSDNESNMWTESFDIITVIIETLFIFFFSEHFTGDLLLHRSATVHLPMKSFI